MTTLPWDQRLARLLVKPLARTPITPNQSTAITLLLALLASGLFATGEPVAQHWGAGLFVLARFFDHFDGELARLTGRSSKVGYYFDYVAGAISYAALFFGIGVGLAHGPLQEWAIVLGCAGCAAALISMPLNLGIDNVSHKEHAVGYPSFGGFELEDGIYLIAPITWLGFLTEFFVLAGTGAAMYCLWTLWRFLRTRRQLKGT